MCRPYIIILLFALLSDQEIYCQTNAPSKIKVVKATDTTNQLIGRWAYTFTKFEKNAIRLTEKKDIDTLDFFPDNKYLQRIGEARETGTWKIDAKSIILSNREFTMYFMDTYINEKPIERINQFGKMTKDTLTFLNYLETSPPRLYSTDYYIRLK